MLIKITDAVHWHQLRAKHIGASEVAGLANLSPYITAYSLYHVKAGTSPQPSVNEHSVSVGVALEGAIAALYASQNNLDLTKVKEYHQCDALPFLGATLDYRFVSHEGKWVIVEIKHVTTWAWRDHGWSPENDYIPPHYEMQIVSQMMCTGAEEGRVVVFCDGEIYTFFRKRGDEKVEKIVAEITRLVTDMERRIKEKDIPDVFGKSVDLEVMGIAARADLNKPLLDLSHERDANNALHELYVWQENAKMAEDGIKKAKAQITLMLERHSNDGAVAA